MHVCMYVRMYVCMFVCMYVCMYVCMFTYFCFTQYTYPRMIYIYNFICIYSIHCIYESVHAHVYITGLLSGLGALQGSSQCLRIAYFRAQTTMFRILLVRIVGISPETHFLLFVFLQFFVAARFFRIVGDRNSSPM